MKKRASIILCLALGLVGCFRANSDITLKAAPHSGDNSRVATTAQDAAGPKVVTAVPAMTEDDKNADAPTAEDKAGAVAVKMEY